jgi:glycerophosphoryl diester phosphodiesterase
MMNERNPRIIAHRCGMGGGPENTLLACRKAFDEGASAIECDVRLTRDGEPFLIHTVFGSNDISKVTGCDVPLSNLAWSEIKELKVEGSRESPPHLDDVLAFVAERNIQCYIEPKEDTDLIIDKLVQKIHEFDLVQEIRFISFFHWRKLLKRAKDLDKNIGTNVILINPLVDWKQCAELARADIVTPGWKRLNWWRGSRLFASKFSERVRRIHALGIEVTSGIANDEKNFIWLARQGVDGIWTDNVLDAKKCLERI